MRERHRAFIGLGGNLGDRQANILQALQYLQTRADVRALSSLYETEPVGFADQPKFLNAVCEVETPDSPEELLHFLKWIERRMGRMSTFRNGPRPIDCDIIFFDDLTMQNEVLEVPHPRMHERAFVLAPLAEIAPTKVHPRLEETVAALLAKVDAAGVAKVERSLCFRLRHDAQAAEPTVPLALSRVGVTRLERVIHLSRGSGRRLFHAEMDLFAHLEPGRAGVHMSRFSEILEELADEVSREYWPDVETLSERLACRIVETQQAARSEVAVRARYPMTKTTPISARQVEELFTFIGMAASDGSRTRRVVGVEVDGLTACPCAQDLMREHARGLLGEDGFSPEQVGRILELVPLATHNQRGRGTLMLGTPGFVQAEHLVHLVEASMSSEIYELLKRPDEFFVVNKAHTNPRFAEDVVREMLRNVLEVFPDLPDETFVLARQENFESIHRHNAFAERSGLLGDLRAEPRGAAAGSSMSLSEWLGMR